MDNLELHTAFFNPKDVHNRGVPQYHINFFIDSKFSDHETLKWHSLKHVCHEEVPLYRNVVRFWWNIYKQISQEKLIWWFHFVYSAARYDSFCVILIYIWAAREYILAMNINWALSIWHRYVDCRSRHVWFDFKITTSSVFALVSVLCITAF
jgi:hypothetical protein